MRCSSPQRLLLRRGRLYLQNAAARKGLLWGTTDGAGHLHAEKLMLAIAGDLYATKVLAAGSNASKNHDKTELAGCKTLAARTRGT